MSTELDDETIQRELIKRLDLLEVATERQVEALWTYRRIVEAVRAGEEVTAELQKDLEGACRSIVANHLTAEEFIGELEAVSHFAQEEGSGLVTRHALSLLSVED